MARDPKKRQKALVRKAARRKQQKTGRPKRSGAEYALFRSAVNWPLHECLVTKDWQAEGEIVQILVARRSTLGQIAVGMFLVDLGCLGVKSAFGSIFSSQGEYAQKLRNGVLTQQTMIPVDPNLAAKIVREGIAYAHQFGFSPDPDYQDAMVMLKDADPDACDLEIPLGKDGKPFFIAGPYDDVERIMAKLTKAVGPGGFLYLVPLGGDEEIFFDEDEDEESG